MKRILKGYRFNDLEYGYSEYFDEYNNEFTCEIINLADIPITIRHDFDNSISFTTHNGDEITEIFYLPNDDIRTVRNDISNALMGTDEYRWYEVKMKVKEFIYE